MKAAARVATRFRRGELPENAMIRDYSRLILEVAYERGVGPQGTIEEFRPPYESDWPLQWPSVETVEAYKDSTGEYPKLYYSCMHDDFAVYSVAHSLRDYTGLDLADARRWIFQHVLDLGYETGLHRNFDAYMLGKYGGGRSRPSWAERIGKKYQWIAFYQLIARVDDHLEKEPEFGTRPAYSIPELQAPSERNVDPTILLRAPPASGDMPGDWISVEYSHGNTAGMDDAEWLATPDWPDTARLVLPRSRADISGDLLLLYGVPDWTLLGESVRRFPSWRRVLHLSVSSYLVRRQDAEPCFEWLSLRQLFGEYRVKRCLEPLARPLPVGRDVLVAVRHPYVGYARRAEGLSHGRAYRPAGNPVLYPKVPYPLIGA